VVMTYSALCIKMKNALLQADIAAANLEARELLCSAAGIDRQDYFRLTCEEVTEQTRTKAEQYLSRRLMGEPVAYITGTWEFYGVELHLNKNVLIPRTDTEVLAGEALKRLHGRERVLDLCCGSGCIGIALALNRPELTVTLADISPEALAVAGENIFLHALENRVRAVTADALGQPHESMGVFDMIVCNPPYIPDDPGQALQKEVLRYEPHLALFGGAEGLDFYRSVITKWKTALKPGGAMLFELGIGQSEAVCRLFAENGFEQIETAMDTGNIVRVAAAVKM